MKTQLAGIPALNGEVCELYEITLTDGTTLRCSTGSSDVIFDGHTYSAGKVLSVGNVLIERGVIACKVGLEVQTVTLTLHCDESATLSGIPLPAFVRNGGFDSASIKIYRARVSYTVCLFAGIVSDAKPSRAKIELEISDYLITLNQQMPKAIVQATCRHTLYDGGCQKDKAGFTATAIVASGSTATVVQCALTQVSGYFDLGVLTITSGDNAGVIRSIKKYTTGQMRLSHQLDKPCAIGDSFSVTAGCDRTRATCLNRFNNVANFNADPFVPAPEASTY